LLSAIRYEIVSRLSLLQAPAAAALLAVLAAGCGSTKHPAAVATVHPKAPRCAAGSFRNYGNARVSYAAIVRSHAEAVRRIGPGARSFARFGRLNVNGVPTVFGIRGARLDSLCRPAWFLVQLPMRPNGVTGWVPAAEVSVAAVRARIVVDLSARRVTLFQNGRRVLSATAAIGSPSTPTPTGRYYVNQRLIPTDTSGPFGPGAVGISAFSNVLTGWTQGGPIAIHGTDAPWSIGKAVSNGCIRLPNATLRRVFARAIAGTPVIIHA
jgi:lipoprotein-anchoring transpeptidase ErfK/SrfK